jgi:gamma-glutamyltranspeptidase/glutathione hydrolase
MRLGKNNVPGSWAAVRARQTPRRRADTIQQFVKRFAALRAPFEARAPAWSTTAAPARFGAPTGWRQCAALLLAVSLAGCGLFSDKPAGVALPAGEFQGAAAADEPRAVLVARDILNQDGTAADAAVALALTMTATLPSRVSLGGGGACVARAGRQAISAAFTVGPINRPKPIPTDAIVFMPVPAASGQIGMPGLLRGLATLHARYGQLRWEQLVAPAEGIARFGAPMSRALARDLAAAGVTFSSPTGRPLGEGDTVAFPDLGTTLSMVRAKGAGELYTGDLARLYSAGLGGAVTTEELRASVATLELGKSVPFGKNAAFFTPTTGGNAAGAMLKAAEDDRRLRRSDPEQRAAAIEAAAAKVLPNRPASEGDTGTTGFVVVDKGGGAVACSLTLGRLFGARRSAPPTGIVAAAPVSPDSPAALSVTAALVSNENVVQFVGGAAAGGDVDAPDATLELLVHAVLSEQPLLDVQTTRRANSTDRHLPPSSGAVAPEITQVTTAARVNAVVCTGGLPNSPDTCTAQADTRSAGLATLASRAAITPR